MFDELMEKVNEGAVLRINKGTVHLAVQVEKVGLDVCEEAYRELELTLVGGSKVYVYDCDTITKTRRPGDYINDFKWCFRVVDDEDAVFYVTDH